MVHLSLGYCLVSILTIKHFILVVESCFIYSKRKIAKQTPWYFFSLFKYTFSYFYFIYFFFCPIFYFYFFFSNLFLICSSFYFRYEENCLLWTGKWGEKFLEIQRLGYVWKYLETHVLSVFLTHSFFYFFSFLLSYLLWNIDENYFEKYLLQNESFYFWSIKNEERKK